VGAVVFYESASEVATLTNTFTVAGVPTDPTTVSLTITTPAGVATTYTFAGGTVTKLSTGVYTKDVTCTEDGIWQYVWTGTGPATDVTAGTWTVFPTELNKNYCSMEELKSRFRVEDAVDDFEIKLAVEAASRAIDIVCQRYFWRGTAVRTYIPRGYYSIRVDDLVSVTTLKTDYSGDGVFETTWSATDFQLKPVNPSARGEDWPYTSIDAVAAQVFPVNYSYTGMRRNTVEITGVFGWPAVPADIKQAALLLGSELYRLRDAPLGVAGFDAFGAVRARANPRISNLIEPYRKHAVLVH